MSKKNWTPQQLDAINAESGTLLVSAAAGSGKTSVLVERIVRKLTSVDFPCPPSSLLVVTFTNAAAAEMRLRIYNRLGEKMAQSGEEHRRISALRARLDEMQVCTMDSFCMHLVRENFYACNVEPDFTVLDKGAEDILKAQTVKDIIEQLYEDDNDSFLKLAEIFESGRSDKNLSGGILRLSDFSMSESDPQKWLEGVADNFLKLPVKQSVWGKIICGFFAEGLEYASALAEKIAEELSYCDTLCDKYSEMLKFDKKLIDNCIEVLENGDWDQIISALQNAKKGFSQYKFSADKNFKDDFHRETAMEARKTLKEAFDSMLKYVPATEDENEEDISVLRPVAEELIKATKMFNAELLNRKRQINSYSFSDITHFALSLLYNPLLPDGKTELAKEMAASFTEILIDEYQDTNRAQDTLFTCLSKNGENMFMVGDVKQSIYRFRLASPEIFIEKCESFPYYDGKEKRSKIILSSNFRSRKGVTDSVNYMFSALMSKKCGEIEYNSDEELHFGATYYPEQTDADTEFHFVKNTDQNERETEARYVAKLIADKINDGVTVFDGNGERRANYGDFCILLRNSKGTAGVFAKALQKMNIPVNLDKREGFFKTAEIRLALALLRTADNPSRDVELLGVMMSPCFGFTPDEAAKVKITAKNEFGNKKYSLFAALRLCAEKYGDKYKTLVDTIDKWRKLSACENAAGTVNDIFDDIMLWSIVQSMPDGSLRKANLRTLVLAAEKYASAENAGLSGFVRYLDALEQNGADIGKNAVSGQTDGVHIMTMHSSKGLEFPFVIIAGLTSSGGGGNSGELSVSHSLGIGLKRREPENIKLYDTISSIGTKRSLDDASVSEELRIYYVALTRAKEKLYIIAAPKKCEEKLSKEGSLCIKKREILPFEIKTAGSPWLWFFKAFYRHPDFAELRAADNFTADAQSPVKVVLSAPAELPEDTGVPDELPDLSLQKAFSDAMSFSYKYAPVATAASKHTASDLASEHFSPASFGKSVPAFMFSSELTPAQKGTATHLFMQYCDFQKCENGITDEKKRLVASGRLSQIQADAVSDDSVNAFFKSDIYKRIKASNGVYRERQFIMAKSICEFNSDLPEEFSEEKTVVIGKTDLVFTENGNAVIVDYKTDEIDDISVLGTRYKEQMKMYAEAVKRSLDLNVTECVLYSIKLKKTLALYPTL